MSRIQAIGRVFAAMQVNAFVRVGEEGIVIEMSVQEYQRCQSLLDAWFDVVVIKWDCVLLKEKARGIAEV